MVQQRQSAVQRIQVGVVGLVIVLLFVTLASMVLDRVRPAPQAGGMPGAAPLTAGNGATPAEPLAELGVTPVANDSATDQPANGAAPAPRQSAPAPRR